MNKNTYIFFRDDGWYPVEEEILDPIERGNKNLVKLGPSASIHFGP